MLKTVQSSYLCNHLTDFDEILHDDDVGNINFLMIFAIFGSVAVITMDNLQFLALIAIKFHADVTIRCRVIVFLLPIRCMTLM